MTATGQIKHLIDEIMDAADASITSHEEGAREAKVVNGLVVRVSDILGDMAGIVQATVQAAKKIKLSTQNQEMANRQMVETIAEIRDVSGQVAAGPEETHKYLSEFTAVGGPETIKADVRIVAAINRD